MEKILSGVYRFRLGEPEKMTYLSIREFEAQPHGVDCACPFADSDFDFHLTTQGCAFSLPLRSHVYGFGLQLKAFRHTFKKRTLRCNADAPSDAGDAHAPVPFYVTTEGYGVLVDSARDLSFYCGRAAQVGRPMEHAEPGAVSGRMLVEVPVAQGADVYVFAGENMLDAVQKYNMFCGGGCELPEWGHGIWYRMYGKSDAADWVRMGERFRDEHLPVSVLGLEPGWQTHAYSCSFEFDEARLGDPRGAVDRLHELGYKVNLWEHCYTHPSSPIYSTLLPLSGDYEVWGGLVPDLMLPEARRIFVRQQQSLGVDGFKLDECDSSDHTGGWSFPESALFPSGLDGMQMHHLLGLLYQQTINQGFPGSYHSVRASGALAAPYPFALYSDLYDHRDFIRGVINAGFSGLLWAPEVRHAESVRDLVRRLQTAIFSPQALINAWYLKSPPWDQIDTEKNLAGERMPEASEAFALVKQLFEARMAMVPYLMDAFTAYKRTGKPVFRALILDHPDDEETWTLDDEYLIGDRYLFAPLTADSDARRVYLPNGSWQRNGQVYPQGWHDFRCDLNEYLLFERS